MTLVGRHIGRYRILEQLGQGGMSVVYKGLDTTLEREVAVKVLHPHLAGKEESRRRLAREAKAVAKLHHPNILEVYDFAGAEAEDAYIVTEYIRGKTLREYLTDQSFDPPEVAAMVVHEVASALAHAHESGVIHRDLKPDNVMIREDGVLKLMDFGIAKVIDRDDKMTMTGALVGSPAHMAPEIIEGEEAGAEADVFSLGTMLYLFATTRLPFSAPNTTATLRRILDGLYDDPRQLVPTVSDELAEIIATCLMREPGHRYATAGKLRDALAAYLHDLGITRVSEELVSFFADPPSYRRELVSRLTTALTARGEALITEKRPAKALSALNQVMALDAGNARALRLLEQMNQARLRQKRKSMWLRASMSATLGLVLLAGASQLFQAYSRAEVVAPPRPQEPVTPPTAAPPLVVEPAAPAAVPAPTHVAAVTVKHNPLPTSPAPPVTPVEVVVNIRPWGHVTVGNLPRSATERPRHGIKLAPGKHRLTVTCEQFCSETGTMRWVEVVAGRANVFNVPAPLKSSQVSFFGFPLEAVVTVGTEQRTVAETQNSPITVQMPPEGSTQMGHKVTYEVTLAGHKPVIGTRWIQPGTIETIDGTMERE